MPVLANGSPPPAFNSNRHGGSNSLPSPWESPRESETAQVGISTEHHLSPADYRARWNLGSDYPLVAPDYATKRKELAVEIGLGRKSSTTVVAKVSKPRERKKLGVAFDEPAFTNA